MYAIITTLWVGYRALCDVALLMIIKIRLKLKMN